MLATKNLEQQFGYQFKDAKLLEQALTHRSASKMHYERLEFLGDSVLGMIVSKELFNRFPDATEGELTRLRAQIVKGETLAKLARKMGLGEYIIFGPGELKSGSRRRASILADVLESLIGAIFTESGINVTEPVVLRLFSEILDACHPKTIRKDPKTRLQEYLQARSIELPEYDVETISGPAHNQFFKVHCRIKSLNVEAQGEGSSRKSAEQDAADNIYQQITHE